MILWGAYFIAAVVQDPFVDSAPSFGYLETAYAVVNIIFSLIILVTAVVLVFLGRNVLRSNSISSAKQKLLGYFLVLWGAGWFLNAILNVLPNYGYWKTASTGVFIILSLIYLVTAVVLVFLGRNVLRSNSISSAKQKLLGYFLVLWGIIFFVTPVEQSLYSHNLGIAYTGSSIILSLIYLVTAVVLVFLGRNVLRSNSISSAKQKLLGYFLVLWGAGWFLNAILNAFYSYGYWKNLDSDYNIIAYAVFLATAAVLVLLGRKVLGNKTDKSS